MAGLDVTHSFQVTPERIERTRAIGGRLATVLADLFVFFSETYLDRHSPGAMRGAALHDPLAVLAVTHPTLFERRDRHVAIETRGEPKRRFPGTYRLLSSSPALRRALKERYLRYREAARILGSRTVLTEVVAYQQLAQLAASESVSPRTLIVLSYALCGFSHVASVGIFVGGISALAPSRRGDLAALGLRALVGATLATLMTGTLAGFYYYGQEGLLGL